jgi:hypothetical protein
MHARYPEREPIASPAERLGGLDFGDQPLIAVLYTISAALVEFFGPIFWAALIVLFIQAEFLSHSHRDSVPIHANQRGSRPIGSSIAASPKVIVVLDFLMLVYGIGFFAVSILYVLACEKM